MFLGDRVKSHIKTCRLHLLWDQREWFTEDPSLLICYLYTWAWPNVHSQCSDVHVHVCDNCNYCFQHTHTHRRHSNQALVLRPGQKCKLHVCQDNCYTTHHLAMYIITTYLLVVMYHFTVSLVLWKASSLSFLQASSIQRYHWKKKQQLGIGGPGNVAIYTFTFQGMTDKIIISLHGLLLSSFHSQLCVCVFYV